MAPQKVMRIIFNKDFYKRYGKLRQQEKQKVDTRIRLFEKDLFHPLLNNHPLSGIYHGYHSINITGDLRAIYEKININTFHFVTLGTHPELYE